MDVNLKPQQHFWVVSLGCARTLESRFSGLHAKLALEMTHLCETERLGSFVLAEAMFSFLDLKNVLFQHYLVIVEEANHEQKKCTHNLL